MGFVFLRFVGVVVSICLSAASNAAKYFFLYDYIFLFVVHLISGCHWFARVTTPVPKQGKNVFRSGKLKASERV